MTKLTSPYSLIAWVSSRAQLLKRLAKPVTSLTLLSLCTLAALNACSRTECITGMTACADDGGATLMCERGFWVEHKVCAHDELCVEVDSSSGEGHATAETQAECELLSELSGGTSTTHHSGAAHSK